MTIVPVSQAEILDAAQKAGGSVHCARCGNNMGGCVKGAFRIGGYFAHVKCVGEIIKSSGNIASLTEADSGRFFAALRNKYLAALRVAINASEKAGKKGVGTVRPQLPGA